MRKIISVMLALVMTLSLCVTTTWAAGEDTSWYNDTETEFVLYDAADLMGLAKLANNDGNTFAGKTIKLANDIDLGGATWTPIDTFAGTLDGNSHTIKNFVMGSTIDAEGYRYCGFINTLAWGGPLSENTGLVCNLTIQDVTAALNSLGRFGTVACYADGGNDGSTNGDYTDHQVYNVHVKNVKVTSTSSDARVGGMFCRTSRSFKDCTVENLTVNAPNGIYTLGGFVSFVYANNQRFQNCDVKGVTITAASCNHGDGQGIGGFAGCMNNSYGWTNFFEDCDVSGINMTVSGTKVWAGGFVGTPCANIIATGCTAQGTINANGAADGFVGGFMGNFGWKAANGGIRWLHELTNCTANVDITSGGAPAGGFIGTASTSNGGSKYGVFTNCAANGNVTNTNGAAGGFAGEAVSGQYTNCTANGAVNGKTSGGFIGEAKDYTPTWDNVFYDQIGNANEIKLDGCAATGAVTGENAGGLVGSVGEKTSPDTDGSKGELVIRNSSFNASNGDALGATADSSKVNHTEVLYTVRFDANGGSGTMASIVVDTSETFTLPACTFTAPAGKQFCGWKATVEQEVTPNDPVVAAAANADGAVVFELDGQVKQAGDTINVSSDLTLTAQWEEAPAHSHTRRQPTTTTTTDTTTTDTTDVVTSAKTFDAGIAVYAAMGILSLTGSAWVVGKKRG